MCWLELGCWALLRSFISRSLSSFHHLIISIIIIFCSLTAPLLLPLRFVSVLNSILPFTFRYLNMDSLIFYRLIAIWHIWHNFKSLCSSLLTTQKSRALFDFSLTNCFCFNTQWLSFCYQKWKCLYFFQFVIHIFSIYSHPGFPPR